VASNPDHCTSADACEVLASEIAARGRRALPWACHVGRWEQLDGLVEAAYRHFGRVDVLVNNAGIYAPQRKVTKEGREQMLAVNHLGPFLMTNLLLERLDGARVITTSSMAHAFARLDLDDLDAARRFSSWRQ